MIRNLGLIMLLCFAIVGQTVLAAKPKEMNQRTGVANDVQLLIISAKTKALVAGKGESGKDDSVSGCRDISIGNVSSDRYASPNDQETPEVVLVTAPIVNICSQL